MTNDVRLGLLIASVGLLISMMGAFEMKDNYKKGYKLLLTGNGIMLLSMLIKGMSL